MESYSRAYPFLTRLHILQEIETGSDLLLSNISLSAGAGSRRTVDLNRSLQDMSRDGSSDLMDKNGILSNLYWDRRLDLMSPSMTERSTTLAVRRCILGAEQYSHLESRLCLVWTQFPFILHARSCPPGSLLSLLSFTFSQPFRSSSYALISPLGAAGMKEAVIDNWLGWSNSMRKIRRFAQAKVSLRNSEQAGLNMETVLINECKILRENGQWNKALLLLEPIEQNIVALETIIRDKKKYDKANKGRSRESGGTGGYPLGLQTLESRKFYAERLFLATQCMADSKLKNSKSIVARYMCAVDLHATETSHFEFGRYLESLYHHSDVKTKEDMANSNVGITVISSLMKVITGSA